MAKRMSEEKRLRIVKEALAGIKIGVLARMYDVHPETIRLWVKEHRDEISPEEIPSADVHLQELQRLADVEKQLENAKKLLGERDLEIAVLRDLVKKKNPAYLKDLK